MECCAFCTASSYQIKPLFETLRGRYATKRYRDVVHIEIPTENEDHNIDLFYFPFGSMVCWGAPLAEAVKYLEDAKEFEEQPLVEIEEDDFTFSYGEKCKMVEDEIILPNEDVTTKLAVSHSLAQSVKLGAFEDSIIETFNQTRSIPEDLAKHGNIRLSRRQIRQKMGELFIERSSINLHVDVLDTPEFFWDHTELEPYYKIVANDLDIETRGQVLNQRLDVVKELFEMLGNELNHQHSSRLEWIIIWLIVIEVVLTLLQIFNIL